MSDRNKVVNGGGMIEQIFAKAELFNYVGVLCLFHLSTVSAYRRLQLIRN